MPVAPEQRDLLSLIAKDSAYGMECRDIFTLDPKGEVVINACECEHIVTDGLVHRQAGNAEVRITGSPSVIIYVIDTPYMGIPARHVNTILLRDEATVRMYDALMQMYVRTARGVHDVRTVQHPRVDSVRDILNARPTYDGRRTRLPN